MHPPDDTLNSGDTLPRHGPPAGAGATGGGTADESAFTETIRMPGSGSIVFQRYRLERMVGRGGMGVVWQAVDTKLDRTVALKFLPDIVGADPAALKELMDETRRGLELAHPNIVRIHDLVTDEATAAISMEYVEGRNLSERRLLRPHRVFSVEDTAPWIGQLCGAMDYAHLQKRIVHRDVKPANLMLSAEGELKITDFGIARSVSDAVSRLSRTMQQGASGTLPYMSPQQVMGERPHPTDDVYSIGATLYELFTGKPPFYSGDISFQITSKTVPPIGQRREELAVAAGDVIPAEWEEAIAACLDKDPTKRPQTAGELARRLGLMPQGATGLVVPIKTSTSAQKPAEATAVSSASPTSPTSPKKKPPMLAIVLGGMAALVMLATAATAALYWYSHRQGEWLVQTQPAGAQVTMDGLTFPTPATVSLPVGTHRASVTLEGYEPRELEFNVEPGARTDLGVVQLERSAGQLLLSSDPDGVDYEVIPADAGDAEKAAGKTPDTIRLPVGRYSVTMNHVGARKSAEVDVVRNTTSRQSFAFEHAPTPPAQSPTVAVNVEPPAKPAPTPPPPAASAEPKPLATDPIPLPDSPSAPQQNQDTPTSPAMARVPDSGSSRVTLLTGGQGLNPPPAPETDPSATPAPQPPDAGPALPGDPSDPGAAPPVAIAPQPTVEPPAAGYWTLDEILSNSEYATYSEPGRRYLVYKAQQAMKQSADGVPGKGTYKAIQEFQTESTLQPTGQLDSATLAALGLSGQPDKADWSRSRGSSSNRTPESEKTAARKFIERKVLGGRDLKDIFRR